MPAGIIDLPAAAVVTEAGEGAVAVEAAMVALSTMEEEEGGEDTAVEEEEDGGKSDSGCWSGQILNPSHELTFPASSNKFPLSLITSQFSSVRFPGLCALLS